MFPFPFLEGIFVARYDGRRVEYHPDRSAIALDNFHHACASLPRGPNGSGDICLTY
jgi:hypothetical protein